MRCPKEDTGPRSLPHSDMAGHSAAPFRELRSSGRPPPGAEARLGLRRSSPGGTEEYCPHLTASGTVVFFYRKVSTKFMKSTFHI